MLLFFRHHIVLVNSIDLLKNYPAPIPLEKLLAQYCENTELEQSMASGD